MSAPDQPPAWHSNLPNPPTADSAGDAAESGDPPAGEGEERPTVGERVREFVEEYPDRAFTPVSETDGRELRRELTDPERVEVEVPAEYGDGTVRQSRVVEREALPWAAAYEALLESYEADRTRSLRFARGRGEDSESFEVPLENSWMPSAQERAFAELKALERETVGFDTCEADGCGYWCEDPDEHDTEWVRGEYADPCLALVSLTASATPDGEHLPPVDHTDARRDTWGGRDGVRRKLRDVMGRRMGLDSADWTYWRQTEPHAGGGDNACYGHDHVLIIFDRAAVDGDLPLGVAEDLLRPVVDRHVDRCEYAGAAAHGDDAVEVKSVEGDGSGEVGHLANYMADYISVDPDQDLLERPVEFIAWAAQTWAANRNKRSRSVSAGDAVDADRCKQQYRDPDADQEHDHGERLRRDSGRGPDVVCRECGSGWGIDQSGTITAARRPDGGDGGGATSGDGAAADLRSRWESAGGVARADGGGTVVGRDDPPGWRVSALVVGEGDDAEEHSVGGGGVDMVPLKLPTDDGRDLWDRPEGTIYRCRECQFGTYDTRAMKQHTAKHDEEPTKLVTHEPKDADMTEYPDRYGPGGPAGRSQSADGDDRPDVDDEDMVDGEQRGRCARCGKRGVVREVGGMWTCRVCGGAPPGAGCEAAAGDREGPPLADFGGGGA